MEQWKNIDGYDGLYQVSNLGNVKSCERYRKGKNNSIVRVNKRLLKHSTNGNGYLFVHLWKEGKMKQFLVHRLVAQAFIPNTNNLPEVNHKDENPINNRVENLEWCDRTYNINYGTHNEKIATALSIPIYSINITTNKIEYYQSTRDAERITGIYSSNICNCLKGKYKTAGGYKWHYTKNEGK